MRCLFAVVLSILLVASVSASEKKGIGLFDLNSLDRIEALNLAWYYTWQPESIKGTPPRKFVPMVWGGHSLDDHIRVLREKGKVPFLLAINEPDKADQANMAAEDVARLWPMLSELTLLISTPATAGVPGPWFDKFYRIAKARRLKMDFMAVHLYGPPDAEQFLKNVDAIYNKYQMPIWITEFAVADWAAKDQPGSNRYSEAEILIFMQQVLPELEERPYVIRYAWFGAGPNLRLEQVRTSRLFDEVGKLTSLGRYYSAFTWPTAKDSLKPFSVHDSSVSYTAR